VTATHSPTRSWSGDWIVALPLKGLRRAKSRIDLPPPVRGSLALAMALDTAGAVLACPLVSGVCVVTDDEAAERAFEDLGCRVVPDRGGGDLNRALTGAWCSVRMFAPTSGFASLVADLPALRPGDVAGALAVAGRHPRSFVPDAAGTGTTLLAALPGAVYEPAYGPASAERHRVAGVTPLALPADSPLRRDVDTVVDLGAAVGGLGPRTTELLRAVRAA
jgi:2-phospho-L-lactate guanylyltransferase